MQDVVQAHSSSAVQPLVLRRTSHAVSRRHIDPDALKVMYRLLRSGYKAYLVGGGVRDLLLGRIPKDYDIGTDAPPEAVRSLFRNSRIIGRRFKINHVYFPGNKIIEVATFRALDDSEEEIEEPGKPIASDNTYGDPSSDARRRDLTINGLFYDLSTFSVIDFVGGIEDLRNGVIRIIGEPERRIKEDPVRMIRAIRHAARIGFEIEEQTYGAICRLAELITWSSKARVHEEFVRELRGGSSLPSFRLMRDAGLMPYLLPVLAESLRGEGSAAWEQLERALAAIDEAIQQGRDLSVGAVFAAVSVGVVSDSVFPPSEDDLRVERYWKLRLDESDEEQLVQLGEEFQSPRIPRFGDRRRREATALGKVINFFFLPVGVSRKEREYLEDLLRVRFALLGGMEIEQIARRYREGTTISDALFLIRLSDAELAERLEAALTAERSSGERPRTPHRRRRRRGRRMPRPADAGNGDTE